MPPPRLHTLRYAGVLAPASPWRSRLAPQPAQAPAPFAVDVVACPTCQGRMKLTRYLATVGEATEVKQRSPGRGPPYWKSRVLRRQLLGDEDEGGRRGSAAAGQTRWRSG